MTAISIPLRRRKGIRAEMKTMVKETEGDARMDIK